MATPSSRDHLRAGTLAAFLGGAGTMHFVNPGFFDPLVPSWVPGSARLVTHLSGLVELAAAALVAVPATRRVGGWVAFATFVGVFPANIWAALQGGMKDLDPPLNSPAVAWARLPLQFPMMWWAWKVAKAAAERGQVPVSG